MIIPNQQVADAGCDKLNDAKVRHTLFKILIIIKIQKNEPSSLNLYYILHFCIVNILTTIDS